ncbi:Polygalacturonase [Quillaja saponaria]|uniref:Polygalacturonase n=1 Tax=Quillaja saponaria TaxID=32244 RepID=A0AAD7LVD6_QUISA|nr:Polygalacturonase [Quillaja saponaria]
MNILNCKNLTLENVTINAPSESLNTDGIHIGRSMGVHITGADIQTEDDCVSLGDGSQQINIEKVTCGPGHGISVGSLGRVKTWPASPSGVASDLHFEDIVMNNVGTPILIDQEFAHMVNANKRFPRMSRLAM